MEIFLQIKDELLEALYMDTIINCFLKFRNLGNLEFYHFHRLKFTNLLI